MKASGEIKSKVCSNVVKARENHEHIITVASQNSFITGYIFVTQFNIFCILPEYPRYKNKQFTQYRRKCCEFSTSRNVGILRLAFMHTLHFRDLVFWVKFKERKILAEAEVIIINTSIYDTLQRRKAEKLS